MGLPRHIIERVERLHSYHQRSKLMASGKPYMPPDDPSYRPAEFRTFADKPKVSLPTTLLDAPLGTLTLLSAGQDALPESLRAPPQNLKTLASWLYYAAGESRRQQGAHSSFLRGFPDARGPFAFELYVAVFGLEGIDPGLYHFCPREFSLRKLREGIDTILQIRKGRPDLEFLKTLPAAIFVAGSYWRAMWRFGRRGYRSLLVDAGQAVQNLVAAGAGLGLQTITRLRMSDTNMRELIGVEIDEPLGTSESVQAMIAWADRAMRPLEIPPRAVSRRLLPIIRTSLSENVTEQTPEFEPALVHQDCVAPGVAVQQVRPPLTELDPLPPSHPAAEVTEPAEIEPGLPARQVLLHRAAPVVMARCAISRSHLLAINQVAFRGGSFFPMFPAGPHVATLRPFWVIQDVTGLDRGLWYFNPCDNEWHALQRGEFRRESAYIAGDNRLFGDAAAVCVLCANLHQLMTQGGPDTYRLAHLEAGIAIQRMHLAAVSLGLVCLETHEFYDEDARAFFGLNRTGWEALHVAAVGKRQGGKGDGNG